ncbi:peptide ABC transporter permease [Dolosigranulum pigrum]|uniref:oligopeptide ABC transporter permease n=1 Tax=Dolosigranulum pigrum TaxID=29394 RepID=UPI000DC02A9D|nr:oligopeptide ABC transporter permease [Dolosigranulum pigrum]QTJ42979.1 ABC transporter permease [Dolosigranulum pigrum]QTJ51493.1 ABC transporter permease [Dolosigranulum pigrum]QTJ56543.1 ABC transporter permease [Dolosigranulum pigrum]RAN51339.1 peptide ABC transporter permease [Dolosigranulum pigrum]
MWKTVVRRLLIMIPQILLLSILVFVVAEFMPGDALTGLIDPNIDPARLEELREQMGLNDPLPVRYFDWITNALKGDFGRSFTYKVPVSRIIGARAINSIRLGFVSLFFAYAIALPFGLLSGRYDDSWFDRFVLLYNYISYAIPTFVLALLMLFIFGYQLGWFPTGGTVDIRLEPGTWAYYKDMIYRLILPGFTGGVLGTVGVTQILRSEVIDAKSRDYVRTARSKGVPIGKVYSRHIFRNAFLPIASSIGFVIVGLLSGSIFIEQIFTYSGMGTLFLGSINGRDYPVVITLVLLYGVISIISSLISDIIMSLVDPRIRID